MASEDVSKLPKWAQWKIQRLESDLKDCQSQLKAFSGETETAICIDPDAFTMRQGGYPKYLPERCDVEYTLSRGEISISLRDDVLHIHGNYHNSEMVIKPEVSNVFTVKLIPEDDSK